MQNHRITWLDFNNNTVVRYRKFDEYSSTNVIITMETIYRSPWNKLQNDCYTIPYRISHFGNHRSFVEDRVAKNITYPPFSN